MTRVFEFAVFNSPVIQRAAISRVNAVLKRLKLQCRLHVF